MTLFGSYSKTILHTFPNIKKYWHFQRVTGNQYTKHFSRAYIKQYWHFQGVTGKQYYTLFRSLYQAILTFQRTPSKLNYIYTFTELLPNNIKHFFETMDTWTDRKFSKRKFPPKQKGPKKFEIFQSPSYKTRKKFFALHKKNIFGRGIYHGK